MYLEAHDCLGNPVTMDATRVVVYNDNGDPISFSVKLDQDMYFSSRIGDPEFNGMLQLLGLDKLVFVKTIDADKLKPIPV